MLNQSLRVNMQHRQTGGHDWTVAGIPQRGDLITSGCQIALLRNLKNKQKFQVYFVFVASSSHSRSEGKHTCFDVLRHNFQTCD